MNDNETSETQVFISSADLAAALGPFLTGSHPSEAFFQFDEHDLYCLFDLDDVRITVRVPSIAHGFVQPVCLLISDPLLFDYLARVTHQKILLRYPVANLVKGDSIRLSVVADEEVSWPGTFAEIFDTGGPSDGEVIIPDKLALAIDLTARFIVRKSENALRDDIIVFGADRVDARRTEAARTYQLSGMQPLKFFIPRPTALTLASVCRGLTHGTSFCQRLDNRLIIWDDRLKCELVPTFSSSENRFDIQEDLIRVVGAEFHSIARLVLSQGGRSDRKQYSLFFQKAGDGLYLNIAVQIPGAPIKKEGRAVARCKLVPDDLLVKLPSGELILSDPAIRKVGLLTQGPIGISVSERISFREASDHETLITAFSCKKLLNTSENRIT